MNQIRDIVKKYDLICSRMRCIVSLYTPVHPIFPLVIWKGSNKNVVLIDSVSKRYSECGIRIGALITKNAEVRNAVMKFCQARLSPPLIGQIAAEVLWMLPKNMPVRRMMNMSRRNV